MGTTSKLSDTKGTNEEAADEEDGDGDDESVKDHERRIIEEGVNGFGNQFT